MGKHDNELKKYLNELKEMTIKVSKLPNSSEKDELIKEIKVILETTPDTFKGPLFEHYVTFLYKGNRHSAIRKGGKNDYGADVLIYNVPEGDKDSKNKSSKDEKKVDFIIQTKNLNKPMSYDDVVKEINKFENKASKEYNCNQYILISINGFVGSCEKLKNFNMKMCDWTYVETLIHDFTEEKLKDINRISRKELMAHNQVAYEEIKGVLKQHDLLAVVRATGTGKSYLIAQLLHDYDDDEKIVVAPYNHIVEDLKKNFELGDQLKVKYYTYQKIINMSEEELSNLKAKLIIFDEFHHLGAKEWGRFSTRLKEVNEGAKIVGFSATPVRYLDGRRDMTEEFFEGQRITELNLAEAIVRKILPNPTYISSLFTIVGEAKKCEEKINKSYIDNHEKQIALSNLKKVVNKWDSTWDVDKILAKHLPLTSKNLKFIVFFESIKHLEEMDSKVKAWFRDALREMDEGKNGKKKAILVYEIHSQNSEALNKKRLKEFEDNNLANTVDLLYAVDKINEGKHVKGITGVILLRRTASPTVYHQQLGRAVAVGNESPLIFDLVNNFDNLNGGFERDLMEAIQKDISNRESLGVSTKQPQEFKVKVKDYSQEAIRLFQNIEGSLKDFWDFMYQQLKEYSCQCGDCNVPQGYKENPQLGTWVVNQRQSYRKNNLSQERIELLNQLKFDWDPNEVRWKEMYQQLKEYCEQNQHCNVPRECEEYPQLGVWVGMQRQSYKKNNLSRGRIELLNQLNFGWDGFEAQWQQRYQELKEYFNQHKHCNVPDKFKENPPLGNWVQMQRQNYKNNKLSQERIDLLNELNFQWDTKKEFQWKEMYKQLNEYFNQHQHSNVPVKYQESPALGTWVSTQRETYKKNKLSQERIDLLNKLNFNWDTNESQWKEMYEQLKKYYGEYHHCNVPARYKENKSLSNWVAKQRKDYRNNKISQGRIDLLNELNFDWRI